MNNSEVAIIIPSYNEGERLEQVVRSVLQNGFTSVIVVDDGSTDKSIDKLKKYPVTILTHIINRGAGAATETGLKYCRDHLNVSAVIMLDADTQHNPEEISGLLSEHIGQKADNTIGNRFLQDNLEIPMKNRIYNRIANVITSVFSGKRVRDSQSGFKVFSRRALNSIVLEQDRYEHCSEIFIKAHEYKLKVIDVPVSVRYPSEIKMKGQHFLSGVKTFINLFYSVIFRK